MATSGEVRPFPDGIFSLLDTDLYKLTMQSAVLKFFPDVVVTYAFTNRTPEMKLSRAAFIWLQKQIERLANVTLSHEELQYLQSTCSYLSAPYLHYMSTFRLRPSEQIHLTFNPDTDTDSEEDLGHVDIHTEGLWVETILYEIPLLALTSEAYFKFRDRDWTHDGQAAKARAKGLRLLEAGCLVSEFGSRRRRDYHTQELVLQGLKEAAEEGRAKGMKGKFTGTSNVHFAMRFGIPPIGTVAHEWFMGVAAVTQNYRAATETALNYWVATFGKGVLGIALTDTFGTPVFLEAFKKPIPLLAIPNAGTATTLPSAAAGAAASAELATTTLASTTPPIHAPNGLNGVSHAPQPSYAEVFTGVRQDSGDPLTFIKMMRRFYQDVGIATGKTIVFSDSLNVDRCIEYKEAAEAAGFAPSFGVGTFFTNDFTNTATDAHSAPLNIVIKLSSANGRPAVKISDNAGKNTGDQRVVAEIKSQLGYQEKDWVGGDERQRWDG